MVRRIVLVVLAFGIMVGMSPAARADVEQAAASVLDCGIQNVNPQECEADLPSFPNAGGGDISAVRATVHETEVAVVTGRTPPVATDDSKEDYKLNTAKSHRYSEGNCAVGDASFQLIPAGTDPNGAPTDEYDVSYNRVGPFAVATVSNKRESPDVAVVVLVFNPKTTADDLAARCVAGNGGPITVSFVGIGPGIEADPTSDPPPGF